MVVKVTNTFKMEDYNKISTQILTKYSYTNIN